MYYKLTYRTTSDRVRRGDSMYCGPMPLDIGQSASCQLQLPESSTLEPQTYATVVPYDDGKGWFIVKRTDSLEVAVNGKPVGIAHDLHDDDEISFYDGTQHTTLRFQTFQDGDYDPRQGIIFKPANSSHRAYIVLIATIIIAAVTAFLLWPRTSTPHSLAGIEQDYASSIYHITTDSVYLLRDTIIDGNREQQIVSAIELARPEAGTCFLTREGLLVTARHCIEPWIQDEDWNGMADTETMSPELRLATYAETQNRLTGTEAFTLRARNVVSRGIVRHTFYSTDFCMNKSRDKVVCLGSDENPIYWRTIFPIAQRRDMELGDFAYLNVTDILGQGDIATADINDLKQLSHQRDKQIAVVGYPVSDNGADVVSCVMGNCQALEFTDDSTALRGCLQMSAAINKGNSGGPIFAYIGDSIRAVGIVSKGDGTAQQGLFWAVPMSEVLYLHENGDTIAATMIFRR
ncbi:MAG: trypsin-like peptidase domain-containing protein [Bacteroidaceae bacterium]|nr:trypsin-like peptidase domain-containing protein [Bacteroidaceae bacterium]